MLKTKETTIQELANEVTEDVLNAHKLQGIIFGGYENPKEIDAINHAEENIHFILQKSVEEKRHISFEEVFAILKMIECITTLEIVKNIEYHVKVTNFISKLEDSINSFKLDKDPVINKYANFYGDFINETYEKIDNKKYVQTKRD